MTEEYYIRPRIKNAIGTDFQSVGLTRPPHDLYGIRVTYHADEETSELPFIVEIAAGNGQTTLSLTSQEMASWLEGLRGLLDEATKSRR